MPSRRLQMIAYLAAVFTVSFVAVFLAIFFSQAAHSMPASDSFRIDEMEIGLGPPPNSTGIPLNTAVTVDAVASAALDDLRLIPETPIGRVYSEATSALTYINAFYPARLLEPHTLYTVSVTVLGKQVRWSFTTTAEPFEPEASFYLATNNIWISLTVAFASTALAGLAGRNRIIKKS